jgi:hypothetical protein
LELSIGTTESQTISFRIVIAIAAQLSGNGLHIGLYGRA